MYACSRSCCSLIQGMYGTSSPITVFFWQISSSRQTGQLGAGPLLIDADAVALPELTIAVALDMRGNGVGGALLDELVVRCTGKY
jgi:hypothetical protein